MINYQNKSYTNPDAKSIMDQLKKNGVFLNTEEAIQMADKLESAEIAMSSYESERYEMDKLRNSVLKIFEQLKNGRHPYDLMVEYGIDLESEWAINGHGSLKCGTYYKGVVSSTKNGSSLHIEEYICHNDQKIQKNNND